MQVAPTGEMKPVRDGRDACGDAFQVYGSGRPRHHGSNSGAESLWKHPINLAILRGSRVPAARVLSEPGHEKRLDPEGEWNTRAISGTRYIAFHSRWSKWKSEAAAQIRQGCAWRRREPQARPPGRRSA